MGKGAHVPPLKMLFCASIVTVKRSVGEILMHYFHNFSSVSGAFASRPPNLPTLEKILRVHDFELPDRTLELKNKNFLMRMLFKQDGCSTTLCSSSISQS